MYATGKPFNWVSALSGIDIRRTAFSEEKILWLYGEV